MENNRTPGKPTLNFNNKLLTKWITTATSLSLLAITAILIVKINQILFADQDILPANFTSSPKEKIYTITPPPTAFIVQQIEDSILLYKDRNLTSPERTAQIKHWEDQLVKVKKLEDYQLRLLLHKDDPDFDSLPYQLIIEELEESLELAINR